MVNIRNLVTRAVSGLFFVAVMVACIWLSGFYFFGLALFLVTAGLMEFYRLANSMESVQVPRFTGVIGGVLLCVTVFFAYYNGANRPQLISLCVLYIPLLFIFELYRKKETPLRNLSLTVMGWLYVALPLALLLYVESLPLGNCLVLAFFIIIWASDTGAYLVGVFFGKHKMFERISPKKTWEGFFGGLCFALMTGYVFHQFGLIEWTLEKWLYVSVTIFVFGVLGDLVESLFKRSLGIKDSGHFLPGHGGVLDRFDSALIAAPFLFCFSLLLL